MIITLIGARPQFVKAAVVSKALLDAGVEEIIVHSGQHYDEKMSQVFWDELKIPKPAFNMNAGSGSHAVQTAQMMVALEEIIAKLPKKPSGLLLYGDTNTTVAGSIVASKLGIPIIHIEAGLRSFNRSMPEEINRIVTDHLSDMLFCPSAASVDQLGKEGISHNVFDVGDVMCDSFLTFSSMAEGKASIDHLLKGHGHTTLITLHRPVNTDNIENLQKIIHQLAQLPTQLIWPVHPRNKVHLEQLVLPDNLTLTDPLSYFEMLLLLKKCNKVITDSGGLQKEAYWAKKPCLTLRDETEWIETLEGGWNQLTITDGEAIVSNFNNAPSTEWKPLYGSGDASQKIAKLIKEKYS